MSGSGGCSTVYSPCEDCTHHRSDTERICAHLHVPRHGHKLASSTFTNKTPALTSVPSSILQAPWCALVAAFPCAIAAGARRWVVTQL